MTAVPILAIDRLSVEFRTRRGIVHALRGIDLAVHRGEMLGVVGESGSGKSVTAYAAMRLLDRAGRTVGGTINLAGLDMIAASETAAAEMRGREASMIFQNPRTALNPIRRVGRQIEDVLRQHTNTKPADLTGRAIAALEAVRIANPAERYHAYPFELSGGMCQRVMIAMALACEPSLLIADEPTTGLDVTTQKTIMDLIAELARARGLAVMLITHDLGVAAKYCNRIAVMQNGEVVEMAETAALFHNPSHPYTLKLMRATPGPKATLADLAAAPEEMPDADQAGGPVESRNTAAQPARAATPLLDIRGLVKEYPLRGGKRGWSDIFRRLRDGRGSTDAAAEHDRVFRAVDDISFTLAAGESLGLVGESGCGKSTTSSMIARLINPDGGKIWFDGLDIATVPARHFVRRKERADIQMVFQDPTESLNPRFPAFDSIADPIRRLGTVEDRRALATRIEELARMVGLPSALLGRFPHQLSGGQKARVGIARAIALRPRLLILDEPTSALDVSVQAVVLNLLDRLRCTLDMSYIFVSHDLNVVRLLCDRVIVMRGGKIVEEGPAQQLLEIPREAYTRSLVSAIPHFEPGPRPAPEPEAGVA